MPPLAVLHFIFVVLHLVPVFQACGSYFKREPEYTDAKTKYRADCLVDEYDPLVKDRILESTVFPPLHDAIEDTLHEVSPIPPWRLSSHVLLMHNDYVWHFLSEENSHRDISHTMPFTNIAPYRHGDDGKVEWGGTRDKTCSGSGETCEENFSRLLPTYRHINRITHSYDTAWGRVRVYSTTSI